LKHDFLHPLPLLQRRRGVKLISFLSPSSTGGRGRGMEARENGFFAPLRAPLVFSDSEDEIVHRISLENVSPKFLFQPSMKPKYLYVESSSLWW
jgi:hypothetical protein